MVASPKGRSEFFRLRKLERVVSKKAQYHTHGRDQTEIQ